MRIVFFGAGSLSVATARILIRRGHDVVMVERDKAKIEALSDEMDCGFLHGDGTKPAILRETNPAEADFFFCLTSNDQNNILASLVSRSLGFQDVVTKIGDPEFEPICVELGLEHTIIPDSTVARTLADMVEGHNILELSTMIKGEVRFFTFIVGEDEQVPVGELELPDQTRVVCIYRGDEFILPDADHVLREKEQVLLITHRKHIAGLAERWAEKAPA